MQTSSVRKDLTSASRWVPTVVGSRLVCKYGVVRRLERRQSLGRCYYFKQFDFDAIGFKHLGGELVVILAVCAVVAAADLSGGVNLMLGNVQNFLRACAVLELLNRFSKRIEMPVVMGESLFLSSDDLIQAVAVSRHDASSDFTSRLDVSVDVVFRLVNMFGGCVKVVRS